MLKSALLQLGAGIAIGARATPVTVSMQRPGHRSIRSIMKPVSPMRLPTRRLCRTVEKCMKGNHGTRVAGGFNKTKLVSGSPSGWQSLRYRPMGTTKETLTKAMDDGLLKRGSKNTETAHVKS